MRILSAKIVAILSAVLCTPVNADVTKGVGQPMSFDIGYGIMVNEGSDLNREWVIVNDERLPVSLVEMNANIVLPDSNWAYEIDYVLEVGEPISAIEVRFIPFNIWGEKDRALSTTDIASYEVGTRTSSAQWRIFSENDAVQHYAMLGYVAQVKLSNGAILRADTEAVVAAARQFSVEFSSGDLQEAPE